MKKKILALVVVLCIVLGTVSCGENEIVRLDDNYGTYYEVFVYSFFDSNGDGIGDLPGLTSKLDYINDGDDSTDTDLGVDGIWLMPIMPASTYHKYDVNDYKNVDKAYGTLEDFDKLISACNERGLDVIIDLTVNHTGSGNEWFVEAVKYIKECEKNGTEPSADECKYFGYYNFTKEYATGYCQVPGTSNWYYEAKFSSNMPDLNMASPDVRAEYEEIAAFWIDRGVKGFRLDAVKEIYSGNTPANVEVLSWFNSAVKNMKSDAYIVAECWTAAETYAKYYESGVDSFFDFYFSDGGGLIATVAKVRNKSANAQTYAKKCQYMDELIKKYNPDGIDAPFYVNHDQDRAAGYYTGDYAMSELKMGAALNLMMTGNCFIYYGEELGMSGSGKDENKRAPMYWSKIDGSDGMCKGPSGMETINMKYDSLNEQEPDPNSIYNFYKDAIKLRNQNPEIARGSVENLADYGTKEACVIKKTWKEEEILILINVSDSAQTLDLNGITLGGEEASSFENRGWLFAGEVKEGNYDNGIAQMPAFSVLVLK